MAMSKIGLDIIVGPSPSCFPAKTVVLAVNLKLKQGGFKQRPNSLGLYIISFQEEFLCSDNVCTYAHLNAAEYQRQEQRNRSE